MNETTNAQRIEKLRRNRQWLTIIMVIGALLTVALFIAGLVNQSLGMTIAGSSGFAAIAAGWSGGFATMSTQIKKLSA